MNDFDTNPDMYGKKLIRDFIDYNLQFSKRNVEMARFNLHYLLGQKMKNQYFRFGGKKIDVRAHIIYFQDTGSGKGAMYPQVQKFGKDLGMRTYDVTHCTSESLIGSPYRDGDDWKISQGMLYDADLYCMEEADELFANMENEQQKNSMTYIQKTCNSIHGTKNIAGVEIKPCHIYKKLTQGPAVSFDPHASFLFYSYVPQNFIETVVTRGLIPRFITVIRHVTLEEREEVWDELVNAVNQGTMKDYDSEYKSILNRLKVISREFSGKTHQFDFSGSAIENIRKTGHIMANMIRDTSPSAKGTLEGFLIRYGVILHKLAIHHAILDQRWQVETKDAAYAKMVLLPVWSTLMSYLELNLIPDDKERLRFAARLHNAIIVYKDIIGDPKANHKIVKKHEGEYWVRRQSIIERVKTMDAWLDCSENAASTYFKEFEKAEREKNPKAWFVNKTLGRTPYVQLVRDLIV